MSKKIRVGNELLLINILVLLPVVIIALFPLSVLRFILGLPFLLFFPVYTLIKLDRTPMVGQKGVGGCGRVAYHSLELE